MKTIKIKNEISLDMMIFSNISETGEVQKHQSDQEVCTSAMNDWVCCMVGAKPPKNFGKGMVNVGKRLGISATAENLEHYARNKKWIK